MAQMIPSRLRTDVKSRAERFLYDAFRTQLSDDFTVFHSVAWQQRNSRGGVQDGEADFVIAHPRLGVLVLEVKGGLITYNEKEGQWYTNGNLLKKDPFNQATDNKHSLRRLLEEQPAWPHHRITFGHAVAFPDVEVEKGNMRPDAPRQILLDGTQLNHLQECIRNIFNYWYDNSHTPMGHAGIEELVRLLTPSLTFRPLTTVVELEPKLGTVIETEDEQILELSQQQIQLLDFLSRQRRVAISGCAGSGKTILAVEKARRLSQQGFHVLLTCYNRNLAEFLQFSLKKESGIEVAHFHGLATDLVRKAGLWPVRNSDSSSRNFFDKVLPTLLTEAADKLKWRVDAVIVDEGQDFQEDWWLSLQYLLQDPDNGILYIFYDDNQNLYQAGSKLIPLQNAPFPLVVNHRNTQSI